MSQSFIGHVERDEYDEKYTKSQEKKRELSKKIKGSKSHEHKVTKRHGLCDTCGYNTLQLPNKELKKRGWPGK